jgi:HK97 family phage portal protein
MTLIQRLKAAFTKAAFTDDVPPKFTSASGMTFLGRDVKRPDFSHQAAVRYCSSWVYAAARLNAIAVASQPLRLYVRSRGAGAKLWNTRRTDRRTKAYLSGDLAQLPSRFAMSKAAEFGDDYEAVTDRHPLLDLLARVNPYQNGFDATVLRVLYLELTGNAYVHPVIDRRLGVPAELWTMPSQWTEIVPGEGARGEPFIKGYRYGPTDPQKVDFAPDEVIHFKYPNPRDMYYGLGKVEAAWGAVTSNEALHEMDYFFFKNKSRPDYLAVIKGNASEAELDRFTAEVENKVRGTQRTGKFLAVTGDVDLKPLSFPPKDLEGREEIVEEIAAIFGVPVSMLRANDPNLASATVGFASWKETTILPACRMDEEVLNQSLLPLFGIEDDAFLAYDNPVKRDEVQESSKRLSYVQGGILTANEARQQEGLEPSDDRNADRLMVNGQPIGGVPTPIASPIAPARPVAGPSSAQQPVPAGEAIADTALNGAQISSLVDLAKSIQLGELPKDSAVSIASAAFPTISAETIASIFNPISSGAQASVAPAQASADDGVDKSIDGLVGPLDAKPEDDEPTIAGKSVESKDALGDCVSAKIPKLIEEGYPQDQAIAIAYSMCAEGKGLEAAIGKAVEDVDTKPPETVAANARRALEVRETKPESQRGMTEVGIARARDLANRENLSEDTIRRMVAYFERHESDKQGETWDEQGKGWQAWNGWGGDEGWAWAKRKVEEFDRERGKKCCGCGCAKSKRVSHKALWEGSVSDRIQTKSAESEGRKINQSEEDMVRGVSQVFDKQMKDLLDALAKSERPTDELIAQAERLLRSRNYQRAMVDALAPYLREAIQTGVTIGIDTVAKVATNVDFDLEREDLAKYAETESIRLARQTAQGVTETTSVKVREVLGTGLENGETVDQLADRVQTWAESQKDQDGSWNRARTVARTEAARAARTAEVEAWQSTGMVTGKTWLLAPDPCEFCEAAAKRYADKPIALNEPFYQKGDLLFGVADNDGKNKEMLLDYEDVNGPPLHPNCRCSMQPAFDAEMEQIARDIEASPIAEETRRALNREAGIQ